MPDTEKKTQENTNVNTNTQDKTEPSENVAKKSKAKSIVIACVAIAIVAGGAFAISSPGKSKQTTVNVVQKAQQKAVTGYLDGTSQKKTVKAADMKGYKKIGNTSTVFTPAAISDANKMFANKETGVYLFGFETCPFCQSAVPVLNKAAKKAGWIVNYVDIYNQRFDKTGKKVQSTEEDYVQLKKNMAGFIQDDTLYSPTVMFVKDGKIVGYQISFMGLNVDGTELTEDQAESLQKVYEDAFAKLA